MEMFIGNSFTFYERQITLLNIVVLRTSEDQNIQALDQRYFGKVTLAKQIKLTQVYDKW